MKKITALLLCMLLALTLSSCSLILSEPEQPENTELTVEYVYGLAKDNGYEGSLEDFINEFKGESGPAGNDGKDGVDGKDGLGIKSVTVNATGHLIVEYSDSRTYNAGLVIFTPDYDRITPSIGDNGNWYIGGEDTGVPSNASDGSEWYTGATAPTGSLGFDGDFYISTSTLSVYYKESGLWNPVGSVKGGTGGGSEMSQAAISRAMLSSVSLFCESSTYGVYQIGSGVIYQLDKEKGDAYIITNHHVVYDDAAADICADNKMYAFLYGKEYSQYAIPAVYVGGSATYDIAVLKVTGSDVIKTSNVRTAVASDSDAVSVLDTVIAVGNPLGEGISATKGSVNVTSEYMTDGMRVMRIDVPINQGNSGGGLFNSKGELVGIVDAKLVDEAVDNVGYAIPSNVAIRLVENIIYYCDGKQNEKAKLVTFGISLDLADADVRYDEETEKLINNQTVKISEVTSGSIAEGAGLAAGDIIISVTVGDTEYNVTKLYHPSETRLMIRPGDTVVYKINRDGAVITKAMQLSTPSYFVEID